MPRRGRAGCRSPISSRSEERWDAPAGRGEALRADWAARRNFGRVRPWCRRHLGLDGDAGIALNPGGKPMSPMSRRSLIGTAAAGVLTATAARAQTDSIPQPRRPGHGGTDPGPRNLMRDRENPDILVPPATDHGTLPNLRFSFSDSHARLESGGWTRQVTVRELGVSKNIAGVNMRLNAGGVRELHWHKAAEWAYMLYGTARITAIDANGRNFVDDVGVGDLWYFPPGIPHSIQGLGPDGCEFLLVFDDGDFDE